MNAMYDEDLSSTVLLINPFIDSGGLIYDRQIR
jgi:hypothetical protein